jgi:hypothetical protein
MNVGSNRQLAGEYGGRYISSASGTVTGNFQSIHALEITILGATVSNITNFPAGVTLQAGDEIAGVWTSVTISSGSVIAYNRKYA